MENLSIYSVAKGKKFFYFIYEENAKAKAEELKTSIQKEESKKTVFDGMVKDSIFVDTAEFLEKSKNYVEKIVDVEVLEPEQEQEPEEKKQPESKTEDLTEVLKQVNFFKSQLDIISEERTELMELIKKLADENKTLKSRKIINLDEAKQLYDRKMELLKNQNVFFNSIKEIDNAKLEMSHVVDFEESKTFRLVLHTLDHSQQEAAELFGLSNNFVIYEVLNFINEKVNNKINSINDEIKEIEAVTL